MSNLIAVGPVANEQKQLLADAALRRGIGFRSVPNELAIENVPALGYVSFLPCTLAELTRLFGVLPKGVGCSIPFFQCSLGGDAVFDLGQFPITGFLPIDFSAGLAELVVSVMANAAVAYGQRGELIGEILKYRKQNRQLINVATALSSRENLDSLLVRILSESRELTGADAGSIYVREKDGPGGSFTNQLRFKISQNDTVPISDKAHEFVLDINKRTIAGYVAETGTALSIDDVYQIDESAPYRFGKEYDIKFDYRMKSMLTVPLKNLAEEIVGVLQLMNKKDSPRSHLLDRDSVEKNVIAFSYSDLDTIASVAALAAVSIERIQLYESIQQLFEGFLSSSIAAIDERDRVTSGHSRRVMGYAMALADAINMSADGPFSDVHFGAERKRQFKFAALLHDIGKIGVPEQVLTKEFRLEPAALNALMARLDCIRAFFHSETLRESCACWESIEEIEGDREFLRTVNTSCYLDDAGMDRLARLRQKTYRDFDGAEKPILTDDEWTCLSVRKGNLTDSERELINSHASSTRRILSKIPWGKQLSKIADIACHHHEKMDGSGYPDGLRGEDISLESRMLAVIDIYEALVAQDRPYKPAMEPERAVEILCKEAAEGHLDNDVVAFFVANQIYHTFGVESDRA